MNKFFKKSLISMLALVLIGAFVVGMTWNGNQLKSKASGESISEQKDEDVDVSNEEDRQNEYTSAMDKYELFIESVEEKEIVKLQDNKYIYDEKALNEEYTKYKIDELCNEKDSLLHLVKNINEVNSNIRNDNMIVMPDSSLMYTTDVPLLTRGGKTYDKTYWWGKRRFKSTKAATKWAHQLNKAAAAEAGLGVIGTLLGPAPAIAGGISSSYLWMLAEDVNYVNNTTKRGIKVDIPWVLVGYKVRKQ